MDMNGDRISALEREVAILRAEVADVRQALKIVSGSTTDHIVSLGKAVGNHGTWLTRLAYKVMPEYEATRQQIDKIFDPRSASSTPTNSST